MLKGMTVRDCRIGIPQSHPDLQNAKQMPFHSTCNQRSSPVAAFFFHLPLSVTFF